MATFKQEAAPPGGYGPIDWLKFTPKSRLSGVSKFAILVGITAVGAYGQSLNEKMKRAHGLERKDIHIALTPFVLAERDRAFLKQLNLNRDEEAELMKNVPGWEVGKLYGEDIFVTLPKDKWQPLNIAEYYAHTSSKHFNNCVHESLKH